MIITLLSALLVNSFVFSIHVNQTRLNAACQGLNIANGNVSLEQDDFTLIYIKCHPSYDLVGPGKMQCVNGRWNPSFLPQCVTRCNPPPFIWNGGFQIEGEKTDDGKFKRGTLVTYTCSPGYYLQPSESKYRLCKDGKWTGTDVYCEPAGCRAPDPISNGYYVHENVLMAGEFGIDERLHYNCNNGYVLTGASTQKCLSDGTWSPKIQPKCIENEDSGMF